MRKLLHATFACAAFASGASAQIAYVESVSGDLSDNRLAPTSLTLGVGTNSVAGTFGPSPTPDVPDLDYVTLTVPAGTRLTQIIVADADIGGAFSFIGAEAGTQVSVAWDEGIATPLLGWHHFASSEVGTDILTAMGAGSGAIGFTPPLPAGPYTFWIMEIDLQFPRVYEFLFVVETVCRADFNNDGVVNSTDVSDFINAWFADLATGTFITDWDGNGVVNSTDVSEFINDWFVDSASGC
jgi:hypothetical protein